MLSSAPVVFARLKPSRNEARAREHTPAHRTATGPAAGRGATIRCRPTGARGLSEIFRRVSFQEGRLQVGSPGAWLVIEPTTTWTTMKSTLRRENVQIAT